MRIAVALMGAMAFGQACGGSGEGPADALVEAQVEVTAEVAADPCESNPCFNDGVCVSLDQAPTC